MKRRAHDAYPTVAELAAAIVSRLAVYFPEPERIIEPTAGDGAFVRAARDRWPNARIIAVDLVGGHAEACYAAGADKFVEADAREVNYYGANLVLGNLPFTTAASILHRVRETASDASLGILLPVSFLGRTRERNAAWWEHVSHTYFAALHPRPSFTGDGKTDRMEYALYGFGAAWVDSAALGIPIVWRPE